MLAFLAAIFAMSAASCGCNPELNITLTPMRSCNSDGLVVVRQLVTLSYDFVTDCQDTVAIVFTVPGAEINDVVNFILAADGAEEGTVISSTDSSVQVTTPVNTAVWPSFELGFLTFEATALPGTPVISATYEYSSGDAPCSAVLSNEFAVDVEECDDELCECDGSNFFAVAYTPTGASLCIVNEQEETHVSFPLEYQFEVWPCNSTLLLMSIGTSSTGFQNFTFTPAPSTQGYLYYQTPGVQNLEYVIEYVPGVDPAIGVVNAVYIPDGNENPKMELFVTFRDFMTSDFCSLSQDFMTGDILEVVLVDKEPKTPPTYNRPDCTEVEQEPCTCASSRMSFEIEDYSRCAGDSEYEFSFEVFATFYGPSPCTSEHVSVNASLSIELPEDFVFHPRSPLVIDNQGSSFTINASAQEGFESGPVRVSMGYFSVVISNDVYSNTFSLIVDGTNCQFDTESVTNEASCMTFAPTAAPTFQPTGAPTPMPTPAVTVTPLFQCCIPFQDGGVDACDLLSDDDCTTQNGTHSGTPASSCDGSSCGRSCAGISDCLAPDLCTFSTCDLDTGFCVDAVKANCPSATGCCKQPTTLQRDTRVLPSQSVDES